MTVKLWLEREISLSLRNAGYVSAAAAWPEYGLVSTGRKPDGCGRI